ncbi:MAG TPA: hypothetical protein VJ757_00495 [Pseudonocardiaceae bacterium]|nr:hypothetical protein [Pseudonocardiaceae bacterium]
MTTSTHEPPGDWLPVDQAAVYSDVHPRTIWRWISEGSVHTSSARSSAGQPRTLVLRADLPPAMERRLQPSMGAGLAALLEELLRQELARTRSPRKLGQRVALRLAPYLPGGSTVHEPGEGTSQG